MRVCSSHWLLSLRRESGIREEALEGGCCGAKAGVPQLLAPGPQEEAGVPKKARPGTGVRTLARRPQGSEWGGQGAEWAYISKQGLASALGAVSLRSSCAYFGPGGSLSHGQQVLRPEEQGLLCECPLCRASRLHSWRKSRLLK